MKNLKFISLLMLFTAFSFFAFADSEQPPPTAELMHYQVKETLPAFIVITNTDQLGADPSDYYFTYDVDMFCRGGYYAIYDYARGFGTDPNTSIKEGFYLGEQMYLGFYDVSLDKYFKLETEAVFIYSSLGLYTTTATIGDEIELNVNPNLVQSSIVFDYIPANQDIYRDANVFFDIEDHLVNDLTVTVINGAGFLEKVNRWVSNPGKFVNYVYHATDTDSILMVKASGIGRYSGDPISEIGIVILTNSKPYQPPPDSDIETDLFTDENIRVFDKKKAVWVENLTDFKVQVTFYYTKKADGKKVSNTVRLDPLKTVRSMYYMNFSAAELKYYTINGQRIWKNQPIILPE